MSICRLLLCLVASLGSAATAWADGGAVIAAERCEPYQLTLFAAPNPLRAGSADLSLLVQNADTLDTCFDVAVEFAVAPAAEPSKVLCYPASRAHATNKLFQAALVEVRQPGRWLVTATVQAAVPTGEARTSAELPQAMLSATLDVLPAAPPWSDLWLWIGWPFAVIALYCLHHWRRSRLHAQRSAGGLAHGNAAGAI